MFADILGAGRAAAPMLGALIIGAFAFALVPPPGLGPHWLVIALAILALAWVVARPPGERRDDVLPAIAIVLTSIGLVTIVRVDSVLAARQLIWLTIALVAAIAIGPALRRYRVLARYKYVWILASIVLFVLVALFGQEVNGAKLWIRIGAVQFEPIEAIKLFVVLFMAAYLAETGDVIAEARPWSLRANAKYLGPLFIGWGTSVGILVFERDVGTAALLLAIFSAMLYVATRRIDLIAGSIAVFGLAAFWAMHHYTYVALRIAAWKHPLADPYGSGYQSLQSLFALAAGGLFGTGYGLGKPGYIPAVATDYVYAAYSEEFGALGGIAVCALFLALVLRALAVAREKPDLYGRLLATGLAATLGFQVFIIVGGVLHLFPLTGITLPFFSYGGSSLVANYLLVAFLWALSARAPAT
ncbi:MAG TPA: FtsW/RodA/SpoVE family cell cycle protein [Candidatus Baltobacteraceae bacterium]